MSGHTRGGGVLFQRCNHPNETGTRLFQDSFWRDAPVGLNLQQKMWLKRMGDFVTCEEDFGHVQQLSGNAQ